MRAALSDKSLTARTSFRPHGGVVSPWRFHLKKFGINAGVLAGVVLGVSTAWAASEAAAPTPMIGPPPPRMVDSATATGEGNGAPMASQRQHCQSLLDQINALPSEPPSSTGNPSVTTADGRTSPTLERGADRKCLEEAYRQQ